MKKFYKNPLSGLIPIFFISLFSWQSCFVTHSNSRTEIKSDSTVITPKIIFLYYSVKKDKLNGDLEIHLINKIVTEGKLKPNNTGLEIPKPGDLECITLDNHMNPVDSIMVPDPLNITVESVNENNELFKKEIAKDSAQFSIRFQMTKKISSIGIKKSSNSESKNSFLLITKLK